MLSRFWGYSPFLGGGGGENYVIGSLCVICKMFPYMSEHVNQVRPCRTRRRASPLVKGSLVS